jgi:hypothetical protein
MFRGDDGLSYDNSVAVSRCLKKVLLGFSSNCIYSQAAFAILVFRPTTGIGTDRLCGLLVRVPGYRS